MYYTVYRHRRKSSKQYEPDRVPAHSLSSSSLANKNKHSALLNSENDFLKPNTGDIPLETINKIREYKINCLQSLLTWCTEQNRLRVIPLKEFHSHVETMHESRDYGFEEEYRVNTYINYFIVFNLSYRVLVQSPNHHVTLLNCQPIV